VKYRKLSMTLTLKIMTYVVFKAFCWAN